MKTTQQIAIQSIDLLHHWIADVFTTASANALEKLSEHFTEDFSMRTMNGSQLNYAQVMSFFRQQQGKKPSLTIEIESIEVITEHPDYVWIAYQERQFERSSTTLRGSIACIKINQDSWQWKYLQETPIPL